MEAHTLQIVFVRRGAEVKWRGLVEGSLFLAGLDGVSVLAGNNLDFGGRDHLVGFHLEGSRLDDKGPYVITETVSVEVALCNTIIAR